MRSGSKEAEELKDMAASPSGCGLFRRTEPGSDHELLAVEIEIGGPAAVLPTARHEEEAAQGEIGEGVLAGREKAADAGGQGHEARLFGLGSARMCLPLPGDRDNALHAVLKILGFIA